jgi:juvenile hormone acid methyltransferase
MNPANYASSNDQQRKNVLHLIDEFSEDLIKICGKCMDIGCGPGDITNNILLPSLDQNAVIIGKQIIKSLIYRHTSVNGRFLRSLKDEKLLY